MTDEQLSALLRLKRYEQPAPQYFDRLLQDLHRRQRAELLHRPLWKIAAERVQTFFSEHSMGHLSYAGALASVLVVGVTGIGLMTSVRVPTQQTDVAASIVATPPQKMLSLQTSRPGPVLDVPSLPAAPGGYESVGGQPRYVIDARPASYEPSSAFNF